MPTQASGLSRILSTTKWHHDSCLAGCHLNYREGGASDSGFENMPVATQMPCNNDDVIIPAGYSTRMVAYGRQLRRRFGSYTSSGRLAWAETKAELPVHFHTPSGAALDMLLSGDTDNEPAPLVRESVVLPLELPRAGRHQPTSVHKHAGRGRRSDPRSDP